MRILLSFLGISAVVGMVMFPVFSTGQLSLRSQRIAEIQSRIVLLQRELTELQNELQTLLIEEATEKVKEKEASVQAQKQAEKISEGKAAYCYEFKSPYLMFASRDNERDTIGNEVRKLQEILAQDQEIYPSGKLTGTYGQLTKEAVQKFQLKHNLSGPRDRGFGVFGKQTMAFMRSLCAKNQEAVQAVEPILKVEKIKEEAAKKPEVKKESLPEEKKEEKSAEEPQRNWVTVHAPNGGEEFFVGRSYTIAWSSSKAERVNIGVVDSEGLTQVLARDVMNEGKYLWIIPPHFTAGDYKIRVAIPDITNLAIDESDRSFRVGSKDLEITSPQGGDVWVRGSAYEITWNALEVKKVELSVVGQKGDARTIGAVAGQNRFLWKIPSDFSLGAYILRLTDVGDDALKPPEKAELVDPITIVRPPLPVSIVHPVGFTNMTAIEEQSRGIELIRFDVHGDESFILKEVVLDDPDSGALASPSVLSNFVIRERNTASAALRDAGPDSATGGRRFTLDPLPIKMDRVTSLDIRADVGKRGGTSKTFVIKVLDLRGEGSATGNPLKASGSASAQISFVSP